MRVAHPRAGDVACCAWRQARGINWLALSAIGVATVTIADDFSAINVALPTMERDFHTNLSTIQWVVNAYALTFGVMIVTGGRLADMFGRRNAFFLGATIFAVVSAAGGVAPTETFLIATRPLMGIGAALMLPSIIGMTYGLLPEDKAELAGGIIVGAAGLGNAIGPLIGGVFTDLATWRWIFFLNVPIAAFAMAVVWASVHIEEAEDTDHWIDYRGIAAISVGLVSLLVALGQVDDWGRGDPRVIFLLIVATVLVVAVVPIERRAGRHGLIPPEIIADRDFAASGAAILCMSATFFAALLYLPQCMESQLGFSPLEAGLGMVPGAGHLRARLLRRRAALLAPRDKAPHRDRRRSHVRRGGPLLAGRLRRGLRPPGAGDAGPRDRDRQLLPDRTTAGVTSVDESQAGLAGGIVYVLQIVGGSIGLGLTTTVFSCFNPPFIDGFQAAFRLDAGIALVGPAISVLFIGGSPFARPAAATT